MSSAAKRENIVEYKYKETGAYQSLLALIIGSNPKSRKVHSAKIKDFLVNS